MKKGLLIFCIVGLSAAGLLAEDEVPLTDGEVWNQGVTYYRAGDVTNALRVLRPLTASKTHGARAAEVVAKLEFEQGNQEEAARLAQIALRAAPADAKANRNFTRAVDGLAEARETTRINKVLKDAQGKDPGAMMQAATRDARALMTEAGGYRTNAPARAVALSDALSARATKLDDVWIPVREAIAQSVTNEEQASTILLQIEQAQAKTKKAAREFGDLSADAYGTMSDVEHDFTRFLKLTAMPPAAMAEDALAQTNAWQDVENFNGRSWQQDALDYTRAFRAKFPAWARAYEQQAQSDTNRPPFTAEDQAKISALATELEKVQLECVEKSLPPSQEKALEIIRQIQELLPKDPNGGQQGQQQQNPQSNPFSFAKHSIPSGESYAPYSFFMWAEAVFAMSFFVPLPSKAISRRASPPIFSTVSTMPRPKAVCSTMSPLFSSSMGPEAAVILDRSLRRICSVRAT